MLLLLRRAEGVLPLAVGGREVCLGAEAWGYAARSFGVSLKLTKLVIAARLISPISVSLIDETHTMVRGRVSTIVSVCE